MVLVDAPKKDGICGSSKLKDATSLTKLGFHSNIKGFIDQDFAPPEKRKIYDDKSI